MRREITIFIAIILGAVIIGGFMYVAILEKSSQQKVNALNQINYAPIVNESLCQAKENSVVTKVIDGDTIIVEGGWHIRLLGIDADEKEYPCFQEAKNRLEELVLGKQIILQKDITDVDKYQRCLRTIFLDNENINVSLVKEGLVVARFYEPDVKYKSEIIEAERQAMENRVGCKWSNK